jgi:ATP synthase subunit 6
MYFYSFFIKDPLEQFLVLPLPLIGKSFGLSNLTVTYFFVFCLILCFFLIVNSEPYYFNNRYKATFLVLVFFVKNVLRENIQVKSLVFFPWFLLLFLNILFFNLIGMVPYAYTVTSSLITTFFMSLSFFLALNLIGVTIHFFDFLKNFLPSGTPLPMVPFLLIIEILSYFARVFSLAIRLFANLMAGHTLMHILGGVIWGQMVVGSNRWGFILLPWFIVFLITGLETVIGGMQAFVFLILLAIYLNDVINLH